VFAPHSRFRIEICSWQHLKYRIARQRRARRCYQNLAGRSADRYVRRDLCSRDNSKRGYPTVKGHACGTSEIGPKNLDGRAHSPGGRRAPDEFAKPDGQPENYTAAQVTGIVATSLR